MSRAKLLERVWVDAPFEHLSADTLNLLERNGLAGPPSWWRKQSSYCCSREGRSSANSVEALTILGCTPLAKAAPG